MLTKGWGLRSSLTLVVLLGFLAAFLYFAGPRKAEAVANVPAEGHHDHAAMVAEAVDLASVFGL